MHQSPNPSPTRRLLPSRKIVQMAMLIFAFLLPFLTWIQAAGCAVMMLVFNVFILPQLDVDLRKRAADATSANAPTGVVFYPISVLVLILLYRHDMYIVGAVWAIMSLGDGMASVVGEALRQPTLPWNREKTWPGFLS